MNYFLWGIIFFTHVTCMANSPYQDLTKSIYCPACQGQVLDESNHPVAIAMKKEIFQKLQEGLSPEEIKMAYQEKYGEHILTQPTYSKHNWLLWLAPLCILLWGSILIRKRFCFDPNKTGVS